MSGFDSGLQAGDRVLIDGIPASVVITADQMHGPPPGELTASVKIEPVQHASIEGCSIEADELDRQLAAYPELGSQWGAKMATGTVISINLKRESITVRDNTTSESVTIPMTQESE